MPWLTKRWISFFTLSAVVGVVLIILAGWANNRELLKRQADGFAYGVDPNGDFSTPPYGTNWTNTNPNNQVLVSTINVQAFDPNSKTGPTLAVELLFAPILNLTSAVDSQAPGVPIQIIIQQKAVNYSANAELPFQPISLDATGNPNNYPFDTYTALIVISTSFLPTAENPNIEDLPLTIFSVGSVQGYDYAAQFEGNTDGSSVLVTFTMKRSTTTRLFAAILFLLMWFLSSSIFTAAMSVWFRGKNTELPLVAISTALLFALPNIRNSQPGVPSLVGTTEDMVGFFWNILLVSVSAIFLLINWVLQNKRPKPTVAQTDTENAGEKK